ncbi:MAG: HIT family protein [Nanoarchaeota archaeon]
MNCTECEKIIRKKNIVYEDGIVIAALNERPSVAGHLVILPKQHATIIEQLPDETMEHMFTIANKLSVALFDTLNCHGTNILVQNGVSAGQKTNHTMIHIIPRMENDNINFHWQTIKMTDGDLTSSQMTLKDEIDNPKEIKKVEEKIEEPELTYEGEEDNYMLTQLERTP